MSAHDLIQRAADSGVELYLDGETLKARGSRQAVENISPELRAHKVEIVALLASARMTAANDPASAAPPELVQPPAPNAPAKRLKYLEWADGWLELDRAYQRHHWSCPQCQAAGRRANGMRCGVGAALYRAYEDASADRSALDW